MRGQKVIVRQFEGRPAVRLIWDVSSDHVYICDEATFGRLERGDRSAFPVGFPFTDVFKADEGVVNVIDTGVRTLPWDQLAPWEPDDEAPE